MPFCTNCGTSVGDTAAFCSHCGAPQAGAAGANRRAWRPRRSSEPFSTVSDHTATVLCYIPVFGVIPAIIVLASQRYRHNPRVRFDGFQSLYLFVAWLIISSAAPTLFFGPIPGLGAGRAIFALCKVGLLMCWIFLLVKAATGEQVRLPIIGDLAARSTTEQL